jgi:hypothetical protein
MVAITATAPRLTPTITHRIQLGIYESRYVRYYYLLCLALCFSVTSSSSIASVIAISAMLLTYPSIILMCSIGTLSFSMAAMILSSSIQRVSAVSRVCLQVKVASSNVSKSLSALSVQASSFSISFKQRVLVF